MVLRLLVVLLSLFAQGVHGQEEKRRSMFIGLGMGIDHGGLGIRLDGRIKSRVGICAGAGSTKAGVGLNAGLIISTRPLQRIRPFITALYGYNTAVRHPDSRGRGPSGLIYNGPSFGGGIEYWSAKGQRFIHFGLLVPIRSEEATDAARYADPIPWPILISIGIHI